MMSIGPSSSYDELPYGDNCFPDTHPDYLATVGRLYGIDTPPVATCRVLELGCAGGGNLLPMAQELPGARFIGVDLSSRQIDSGKGLVDRLGLRNVELLAMSIMEVDERFGSFDYIICHGVYSWVPEEVRDKILEVCSSRLNPDGIAYLSYNTYPGWHSRGMVRDMMAFHIRGATSAIDRVEKARDLLENVVRVLPDQSSSYARILRTEGEFLRGVANSYLYHEHLEETNHPVYFRDLVGLARAKGLQYLAEARTPGLLDNLPAEARDLVESWSEDRLAAEQYLDFLCNRTFRRSILCLADRERLELPSSDLVSSCWVNSNVIPVSADPEVASDAPEEFRRPDDAAGLTTNNPLVKAALVAIHEGRHRPLAFADLRARVEARLGIPLDDEASLGLNRSLLRCFLSNLVELHVSPPRFTVDPPERPVASPLARVQAESGGRVTNLRRRTVELGEFERLVIRQLDGQHDGRAIVDALAGLVESGDFSLHRGEETMDDLEEVRAALRAEVAPCLRRLADLALLAD
jgi:methyltransferase-like protein/2-polyprenyl-3-methyl-5-hydroxy-6-metoxy-1,4-benzoquinol methylase